MEFDVTLLCFVVAETDKDLNWGVGMYYDPNTPVLALQAQVKDTVFIYGSRSLYILILFIYPSIHLLNLLNQGDTGAN